MADTGGVAITVTQETMQAVAQRLVCWDRENGQRMKTVQYRTDGNRPYFYIPGGTCADRDALSLTPGGATITCNTSGVPTHVEPALADVSGLNPNSCEEIAVPTGLAASGAPTANTITVGWEAPATGPAPTGYVVSYRPDGQTGGWTTIQVPAGQLTATASGLTPNTAYDFRVQARQGTYLSPPTADVTVSTAA